MQKPNHDAVHCLLTTLLTNLCRTFHFLRSQLNTHTDSATGAYVLHNRHVYDIHRDTVHHPLAAKDLSLLKKKRSGDKSHNLHRVLLIWSRISDTILLGSIVPLRKLERQDGLSDWLAVKNVLKQSSFDFLVFIFCNKDKHTIFTILLYIYIYIYIYKKKIFWKLFLLIYFSVYLSSKNTGFESLRLFHNLLSFTKPYLFRYKVKSMGHSGRMKLTIVCIPD